MINYNEARNLGDSIYSNYIEPNLPTVQEITYDSQTNTDNLRVTGGGNDELYLQDIIANALGLMYCLEEGDSRYSKGLTSKDIDFILHG